MNSTLSKDDKIHRLITANSLLLMNANALFTNYENSHRMDIGLKLVILMRQYRNAWKCFRMLVKFYTLTIYHQETKPSM